MRNRKIETNSKLIYEDGRIGPTFIFQNHRQRYIVAPYTTFRGPRSSAAIVMTSLKS